MDPSAERQFCPRRSSAYDPEQKLAAVQSRRSTFAFSGFRKQSAATGCWTASRIGWLGGDAAIDFCHGTMVRTHQTAEKLLPDLLKVRAAEVTK